jgi:hypothetical protein
METTPPIAKQHTTRLPISTLANPLLNYPITLFASTVLFDRSDLAILVVNTIDSVFILLFVPDVLTKATVLHITTAVANGKALVGI